MLSFTFMENQFIKNETLITDLTGTQNGRLLNFCSFFIWCDILLSLFTSIAIYKE